MDNLYRHKKDSHAETLNIQPFINHPLHFCAFRIRLLLIVTSKNLKNKKWHLLEEFASLRERKTVLKSTTLLNLLSMSITRNRYSSSFLQLVLQAQISLDVNFWIIKGSRCVGWTFWSSICAYFRIWCLKLGFFWSKIFRSLIVFELCFAEFSFGIWEGNKYKAADSIRHYTPYHTGSKRWWCEENLRSQSVGEAMDELQGSSGFWACWCCNFILIK